ncbi:hypothetical protein FACS1894160_0230 [Bacteroidia bacterium]|nr:hypothetical protein FACS1894160_0230 [Bacteroidia bacterium]
MESAAKPKFQVLVLAERGGGHESFTAAAFQWLTACSQKYQFAFTEINDTKKIDAAFLKNYKVFIQMDYPPYRWSDESKKAFTEYIEKGKGGWVGFHHAALLGDFDGFPMWQWFSGFLGDIKFKNYIAELASGKVQTEDAAHPVMRNVHPSFVLTNEEWYTFDKNPRPNVHVLASVDETSYNPESKIKMGDHPVVWVNEKVKARNVYFLVGHHASLFESADFKQMFENAILWAAGKSSAAQSARLIGDDEKIIDIEVVGSNDTVINRYSPFTEDIKYGFEGGRVLKVGQFYHLISAEMAGDPRVVNMRIGHWKSRDGIDWQRVGTIRESDGDYTGVSQKAAPWGPMVVFNKDDDRWHLVYTSYKAKKDVPNVFYGNYDGIIQHAVSVVKGIDGIDGPYEDTNTLMRYDENPDAWEGLQGVDSFFPYKIGKKWYGFYGSATTQDLAHCQWQIGLAQADKIEGPWTRMSELNPVNTSGYAENPIVFQLKNGVYIAIVDGLKVNKPGYLLSYDGIYWSNVRYIDLAAKIKPWWNTMRTPISLIEESDGTYSLYFTAFKRYEDGRTFGCVSKAKLKISFLNK